MKFEEKPLTEIKKYVILIQEEINTCEGGKMIDEEICTLREKLNNSILSGEDYSVIYKLSVELDQLIAQYYQTERKK